MQAQPIQLSGRLRCPLQRLFVRILRHSTCIYHQVSPARPHRQVRIPLVVMVVVGPQRVHRALRPIAPRTAVGVSESVRP